MKPRRGTALAIGLALIAGACSATAEAVDGGPAADETPVDSRADDGQSGEATQIPDAGSLFAPTEADEPLDLAGGAQSSDDGVEIVTENPRSELIGNVGQATEPWTTDWSRRTIELAELQLGIATVDPRDRIPPIDVPRFEPIADATWLGEREPGALVQFNDETRFYPLSILTRHEIVNDRYGDVPVVVSYCPLCNTALSFDARVDGRALRFGVSGLLRNSDLVMWDDATTTLWQQITGEAVVGELAGTRLDLIPTSIASYGDVAENFPEALSLSQVTGFDIPYGSNSYVDYSSSERPFLFAGEPDPRFPALSRVVGVTIGDEEKAYPFELLTAVGVVNDEIGDVPVAVLWGGDTADALDARTIADGATIGTGIAFDRRHGDRILTFSPAEDGSDPDTNTGTDDARFVDAETGTTWTLLGRAVDGPLAGEQLTTVTHRNEFWFAWAAFFPDADVHGES